MTPSTNIPLPADRPTTAPWFERRQDLGRDPAQLQQRAGRFLRPGRPAHVDPHWIRDRTAPASGQQVGRPLGAGGAVAGVGAVLAMLTVLHLTCKPATCTTGPAAHTDTCAHQAGLTSSPYRGITTTPDAVGVRPWSPATRTFTTAAAGRGARAVVGS